MVAKLEDGHGVVYGERMYQILSLVAKTLLAWLVFAGVFQPQ